MSTRESRLPGPALLCQPSPHRLARQWDCGGRPCSFPELPSGHGGPRGGRKRIGCGCVRPHGRNLVNTTVLHATTAATCSVSGCGLGTRHNWPTLHHLGPSCEALGPCHWSVEGAVDSAVSSARERVQNVRCRQARRGLWAWKWCGTRRAGWRGQWPAAHRVRREKLSSAGTSFCSRRLRMMPSDRTANIADHERLGGKLQHTSICCSDGDR